MRCEYSLHRGVTFSPPVFPLRVEAYKKKNGYYGYNDPSREASMGRRRILREGRRTRRGLPLDRQRIAGRFWKDSGEMGYSWVLLGSNAREIGRMRMVLANPTIDAYGVRGPGVPYWYSPVPANAIRGDCVWFSGHPRPARFGQNQWTTKNPADRTGFPMGVSFPTRRVPPAAHPNPHRRTSPARP